MSEMHKAYMRFVNARIDRSKAENDGNDKSFKDANRSFWAAIRDAVGLHRQSQEAIPEEMTFEIETELNYLLAGVGPPTISRLGLIGKHRTPAEENDKRWAVMYIRACRTGLIKDRKPMKTLCVWFKMNSARTLYNWQKMVDDVNVDDFRPELSDEARSDLISELAQSSGLHWY